MYLPFGLPVLECFKRNIYIFSDSQAAIKALDNSEIYPKLVRDCHQSPMVVAEHNNVQLLSVPGHKDECYKIADQLAKRGLAAPIYRT
jgi:ribonuclease HI